MYLKSVCRLSPPVFSLKRIFVFKICLLYKSKSKTNPGTYVTCKLFETTTEWISNMHSKPGPFQTFEILIFLICWKLQAQKFKKHHRVYWGIRGVYWGILGYTGHTGGYTEGIRCIWVGIRKVYGVYGWYTGGIREVYGRYVAGIRRVYGGYTGVYWGIRVFCLVLFVKHISR